MVGRTVHRSGKKARSGAKTLALLGSQRNFLILSSLTDCRRRQAELRHAAGFPAQTTLRADLGRLEDIGAIDKHRQSDFPGTYEYELTKAGRELLFVTKALERWLARAPDIPLGIGGNAARAAIKALVDGWSTSMLRAIAARPLSLTELDQLIHDLSYPSLERRFNALRLAGLIKALPPNGRGTPYTATRWARQAVAPLIAAARWEQRFASDQTAGFGRLDAEAALLLAMPLVRVPVELSGSCRIAVEIASSGKRRLAGVIVEVGSGKVRPYTVRLNGHPDAWVTGSTATWMAAAIEGDVDGLELGGDGSLARYLLEGFSAALFGVSVDV